MRDQDEGHPARLMQVEKEVDDLVAVHAVEIAGRLISEDQVWPVDDAPRDGDALAFAAGQLVRQMRRACGEADGLKRGFGAALALIAVDASAKGGDLDILIRRQGREQVEVLEHDADLGAAQRRPFPRRRDRLAVPADHAGRLAP